MDNELLDFEIWCRNSWGAPFRSHQQLLAPSTPQMRDAYRFDVLPRPLKEHIAEKLIIESCSHIGSLAESGDVSWYIHSFGRELRGTGESFEGRRVQPLKASLLLIALSRFSSSLPADRDDYSQIRAGGGAMAAMYLLAQVEFLCRVKGRYLNADGSIKSKPPSQLRKKAGLQNNQKRVNRIHQAFILYLYRNRTVLGRQLRVLEGKIHIADRLKKIRDPVMHGELADPAVEADFFALLVAMFYYSEVPAPMGQRRPRLGSRIAGP